MSVEGILPVIPTPFLDGAFHGPSFERLLHHMLANVDGYTLLGSTGEAPSMTIAERMDITEFALKVTPADRRVVVGVTDTSYGNTVALAQHAQQHGAHAVLCAAPYYFANTPCGVLDYLKRLDEELEIDLVLYDNPVATRTTLSASTIVAWSSELTRLTAVKLTDHDLSKIPVLRDAGLNVLAGDDPILARFLAEGVDGVIVIVPALFPESFRSAWDLARQDNLDESFAVLATGVLPFTHVFGIGDEIATTKAILADIGVFASAELRPPLRKVTPRRRRLLRTAYAFCRGLDYEFPVLTSAHADGDD